MNLLPTLLGEFDGQELMRMAWGLFVPGLVLGIPIFAILCGTMTGIAKVVVKGLNRNKVAEIEATLKMEMIERGMSPAEIVQVLEARMPGFRSDDKEEKLATDKPFQTRSWCGNS